MATRSVAVNLTANPAGFIAGFARAGTAAEALDAKTAMLSKSMRLLGGVFIADKVIHGFVDAGKAAGDFQAKITRLQTDANETGKNLGMVSKGILDMAGSTGNTTDALAAGMYKIESAGIHGSDALKVLRSSAEGAKIGFADLTTVADALTTVMTDYHLSSDKSTSTTNELIATVSRGKTNLEALSASLSTVAPAAAVAHVSLAELLGAMATMTAQGTDANKAATYLRQTILQLSNPTAKARTEMQNLGLSAIDVSKNLGARGLTGTFSLLTDAIEKHMGPSGTVFIKQLQTAAKSTTAWQATLANLSAPQQTYIAALADMTGGTKSLQAVLELTGANAATFAKNATEIGASTQGAGGHVKDWDVVQKNFNQRLAEAKGQFEKIKIVLGQDLLPAFTTGAKIVGDFGMVLGKYPHIVSAVALSLAGAGGLVLALKAGNLALSAFNGLAASSIGWRTRNTAAMLAESAAARKAAASVGALDVAEGAGGGKVGLLGRLGRSTVGTAVGVGALNVVGSAAFAAAGTTIAAAAVAYFGIKGINALNNTPSNRATTQRAYQTGVINQTPGLGYGMAGPPGGYQRAGAPPADGADDALAHHAQADAEAAKAAAASTVQAQGRLNRANVEVYLGWQHITKAVQTYTSTVVGMNGAGTALTTHLGTIAKALQNAKDKAAGLAAGIAILSGNEIDASRAQDGFQQQLNDLAASFDKHTKSLRGNSNAVIQNRGLVDEAAQAAQQHAEAVLKQTGSVDKAKAALIGDAKALEAHLAATTGNKKAADDFLASISMLPSQVTTAFDGLHATGMTYGGALVDGFAGGIQQHMRDAILASQVLVDKTKTVFRTGLKMQSPSKVTHQYGGYVATGFANGITDGTKHATAAAKKLASETAKALKSATTTMRQDLKREFSAALSDLAHQISTAKSSLSKYTSALSSSRSDRDQAGASAKGVFTGTGDLSQITGQQVTNWDGTTGTKAVTAGDINRGLSTMLGKDQKFLGDLKRLKTLGLSQSTITQILNMGPDAGAAYAAAILSGGAAEVGLVNRLEGGIAGVGNQAAAMTMQPFNKHIDDLKTEVVKLTTKISKLEAEQSKGKTVNLSVTSGMTKAQLDAEFKKFERETGIKLHLLGVGG